MNRPSKPYEAIAKPGVALALAAALALVVEPVVAQTTGPQPEGTPSDKAPPGAAPDRAPASGPDAIGETPGADATDSESIASDPPAGPSSPASDSGAPAAPASEPEADEVPGEPPAPEPPPPVANQDASADGTGQVQSRIRYYLERVEIRGNDKTADGVIKHFVPMQPGDRLDVDDPSIESIRWRLMGTGWFNEVRLSLEKGSTRGWVVMVVEVEERNTLVVTRVVAGLTRAVRKSTSSEELVDPYAGIGIAETNLFGLGKGISFIGIYSAPQQGLDLRYSDPMFLGSKLSLNGGLFYNNARDFFGYENNVVDIVCPEPDPEDPEPCDPDVEAKTAVVIYDRFGLSLGTGQDLTSTMRYTLDWQGELVNVRSKPRAASTQRGERREPIDFHIDDEWSRVSSLIFGLIFDRRDDPALPSRGQFARFETRVGTGLLGGDYDFTRFEGTYRFWIPLPWGHVLGPGAYAGIVFGEAPFFYRFYASDLTDLVPSRVLDLNLDHRGPPDLLGTSVAAMRAEDLAGRLDLEYRLPLHRGGSGIRGVDAYARVGLYALARLEDVRIAVPGFDGPARVPVDLTFDLGVNADTAIGLFQFGFSSLVRSLPDL